MKTFKLSAVFVVAVLILPVAFVLLPKPPTPDTGQALLDIPSEKSTTLKAPKGHPNKYIEYYHAIRASENGEVEYPVGYRYTAIEQAKAASKTSGQALAWVERGPGNTGGRTRGLLVDPDDPTHKTWWAGSVSGGLWKTINGGLEWKPQSEHLPIMSVSTLAYAESNPDVMYAGTGEGFFNLDATIGNGIFKSTDRGDTWQHLPSTIENLNFRAVNRLAVDPTNPDVVVAATIMGIFRTTDGGLTWTQTYHSPYRILDLRAQPGNFNMQIAGKYGDNILYSTDAGVTWQPATATWESMPDRIELAYSRSHPNIAYAAAESYPFSDLYRSIDGGKNWAIAHDRQFVSWMKAQGWYNNTLAIHPFDPNIVFLGGIDLWRTDVTVDPDPIRAPTNFDIYEVQSWIAFVPFIIGTHGGRVAYLDDEAKSVSVSDYTNIEIRYGQGSQKAHRFTVPKDAGEYSNGGEGVLLPEYQFTGDYVEVPFQVWDTDNNRQLMISFRDQADDGEYNLTQYWVSEDPGTRDHESREYLFIHKYDYDDATPHSGIDQEGGVASGLLYYLWPVLDNPDAVWDSDNMPAATVTLAFGELYYMTRASLDEFTDPDREVHVDHHNLIPIVVDEAQEKFWLLNANDGGVALSKDNGMYYQELDQASAGYNTSQFYGVSKKPGEAVYIGGTQDNGTWLSPENPNSRHAWTEVVGGDGFETIWHASDPSKVLATVQYSLVLRSEDAGNTWETAGDMSLDFFEGQFLTTLASSDKAPNFVYTLKEKGVYVSSNFGSSWTLVPIDRNWGFWNGGKVRVSEADPQVVWAGYGMKPSPSGRRLHVSKDQGTSFAQTKLPILARHPGTYLSGLATHPEEAGTAYALFSRYQSPKVLETKDYGETWTDLSAYNAQGESENGFPEVPTYDLVVMPHAPHVLWVGTDAGIFTSRSRGSQWHYANNGLPAVSVWRMKIRDEELIVGTHGRGIWTLPLSEVATDAEEDLVEHPSQFHLAQNYPNPFNPATTIRFTVPREAPVRLTVFDASGRKVTVLTDRTYAPGIHEITWKAGDRASGMYFYRLETEGRIVHTRTMMLVK